MFQGINKLVNLNGAQPIDAVNNIIDAVFQEGCIILNDVTFIFGAGKGIPCPLIGFEYLPIERLPLLKYSYSEAPYLNRASIVNGYIKENTRFRLVGIKPIYNGGFIFNVALNNLLTFMLDKYVAAGGMFTIITPWSVLSSCVCTELNGIRLGERDPGGQAFEFEFEKINLPNKKIEQQISNYLAKVKAGVSG